MRHALRGLLGSWQWARSSWAVRQPCLQTIGSASGAYRRLHADAVLAVHRATVAVGLTVCPAREARGARLTAYDTRRLRPCRARVHEEDDPKRCQDFGECFHEDGRSQSQCHEETWRRHRCRSNHGFPSAFRLRVPVTGRWHAHTSSMFDEPRARELAEVDIAHDDIVLGPAREIQCGWWFPRVTALTDGCIGLIVNKVDRPDPPPGFFCPP